MEAFKQVLPIKVKKSETISVMKRYMNVMRVVFNTQNRENELLYRMMAEFVDMYETTKDIDITYNTINSTLFRRKICDGMGLRLEVYRTMLNKLRNNNVLMKDNRLHPIIEKFCLTYSKNDFSILFDFKIVE